MSSWVVISTVGSWFLSRLGVLGDVFCGNPYLCMVLHVYDGLIMSGFITYLMIFLSYYPDFLLVMFLVYIMY